ncbi:MAG: leucine-rich repeat domain-containing protein, partial [Clostridia bacterium]|nr:leucine-rich repeat domain-containing protein [Clostridia bacterium]
MERRTLEPTIAAAVPTAAPITFPEAVQASNASDFQYEVTGGTAIVTGYKGADTALEIPSVIDGYRVTGIGENAFEDYDDIVSVTLPEGITSIGNGAFSDCLNITSITLPEGLKSIGDGAFYNCDNLISITVPKGVTSIGRKAFVDCRSLVSIDVDKSNPNYTSVDGVLFDKNMTTLIWYPQGKPDASYEIPYGVTCIGNGAFSSITKVYYVVIPESVTTIEGGAFCYNTSIRELTFPKSVTSIGEAVLCWPSVLSSVTFRCPPPSGDFETSFQGCGTLYYSSDVAHLWAPNGETTWNGYMIQERP